MTISLNVLNHMGLNLYSNIPPVIAEVIANSWDADATQVDIHFDLQNKTITVADDGMGMSLEDINSKYLYVGYQKRQKSNSEEIRTPEYNRMPMGRKGIGKLSLFSIANKIQVYTCIRGGATEAFQMDAKEIRKAIDDEDPSNAHRYCPEVINTSGNGLEGHGTRLVITDIKKLRLTKSSVQALKCRLARRFSIIGDSTNFTVRVDGKPITLADRNYFHKVRFIYQYNENYHQYCDNLERDDAGEIIGAFEQRHQFDYKGNAADTGQYSIKGWIAIARHSNDLDVRDSADNENLNKISIVVRGKVAQDDILQKFNLGGMITKYMFGEIEADFLDSDDQPDIATSGRQSIFEDDERYEALTKFIESELRHIWTKTNKLKERAGLRHALSSNPFLKEWYEEIRPSRLQKFAGKLFGDIEKCGIEESERQRAYANCVLMFEHLKIKHATDILTDIDMTKVDDFLSFINDVDALEAECYRNIVEERLVVIRKFKEAVDENAKERVLQEFIFDHLHLLDPAWERATKYEAIEKSMEKVIAGEGKKLRLDITYTKYRRVAAAHVIVELKRRDVSVEKTEIERQIGKYINALRKKLREQRKETANLPIQAICIVGKLPQGWNDEITRQKDEESLRVYNIRVTTYDELIENALDTYGEFLKASGSTGKLRQLIENIRSFIPDSG